MQEIAQCPVSCEVSDLQNLAEKKSTPKEEKHADSVFLVLP